VKQDRKRNDSQWGRYSFLFRRAGALLPALQRSPYAMAIVTNIIDLLARHV
jgi:hypothetical protein